MAGARMDGMLIEQIQSQRVRDILTGSATPATDLRDQASDMTVTEFREACAYYGGYTKLVQASLEEMNFCREHDC